MDGDAIIWFTQAVQYPAILRFLDRESMSVSDPDLPYNLAGTQWLLSGPSRHPDPHVDWQKVGLMESFT
jgi:hypothetical protein